VKEENKKKLASFERECAERVNNMISRKGNLVTVNSTSVVFFFVPTVLTSFAIGFVMGEQRS